MPELPEVETIKNDLRERILHQKILFFELVNKNSLRLSDNFIKKIVQAVFLDIRRKGKLLIFVLSGGDYLLVHLKMTGQLIYQEKKAGEADLVIGGGHGQTVEVFPNKHTRIILRFANGANLYFNDLRKFGYWQLVNKSELEKIIAKYGPEPLETGFTKQYLKKIFTKTSRNIKAVLLDQSLIAGIGNIYADEILFASGVNPERRAATLSDGELEAIWKNSKKIIRAAIKYRGTTFNNYRDGEGRLGSYISKLKVYGRKNLACFQCGQKISKKKVAGRGTHYCEVCQK